jgi:hypothetical protein
VLRSGVGGGGEGEGFPRNEGGFAGGDERGGFEGELAARLMASPLKALRALSSRLRSTMAVPARLRVA